MAERPPLRFRRIQNVGQPVSYTHLDRKLDALEDIIEAANGKPLLVAYWFKHDPVSYTHLDVYKRQTVL